MSFDLLLYLLDKILLFTRKTCIAPNLTKITNEIIITTNIGINE